MKEAETFSPQLGLNTFYYLPNKRNMSHFTKKCNSFHFYPNIKKPELSWAMDTFHLFQKK